MSSVGSFNCRWWAILIVANGIFNCRWTLTALPQNLTAFILSFTPFPCPACPRCPRCAAVTRNSRHMNWGRSSPARIPANRKTECAAQSGCPNGRAKKKPIRSLGPARVVSSQTSCGEARNAPYEEIGTFRLSGCPGGANPFPITNRLHRLHPRLVTGWVSRNRQRKRRCELRRMEKTVIDL